MLIPTEEPKELREPLVPKENTFTFVVCFTGNAVLGCTFQLGIKYYMLTGKLSKCKPTAIAETI